MLIKKFEYLFFVLLVVIISFYNFYKRNDFNFLSKSNTNNLNENNKSDSNIVVEYENKKDSFNVDGVYKPILEKCHNATVYKHESMDYWIFRVIEKVDKEEDNIYWVLSDKNFNESNKKILYDSIAITDIGEYYVYQYLDFGREIDQGILYSKSNGHVNLKISKS